MGRLKNISINYHVDIFSPFQSDLNTFCLFYLTYALSEMRFSVRNPRTPSETDVNKPLLTVTKTHSHRFIPKQDSPNYICDLAA